MNKTTLLTRLERLDLLANRLKSNEPLIVRDIADELGVSVRTLSRDIGILRERGLPIEADRGRGGGIRLNASWAIGRVNFNYAEAVDLMITLAIAQQMKSPLFMTGLDSVRRKLLGSFPPLIKTKVKNLKDRILILPSASINVLSSVSVLKKELAESLHQAFLMQQGISISYKAKNGSKTKRMIEPHYLLLSFPVWYVLAWDELREDVRTFRCDRITNIESTGRTFRLRPVAHFNESIAGTEVI